MRIKGQAVRVSSPPYSTATNYAEEFASRRLPKRWVITGVAGFIGSNQLQALLECDREVVGLDNFATGTQENLDSVRSSVTDEQWSRFSFIEGDIRSIDDCAKAVDGADVVLHQAGLNSVPRSMEIPGEITDVNVNGFVALATASARAGVGRFVYASSSSVYGNTTHRVRREDQLGEPLSPYAASKRAKEAFGSAYHLAFELPVVALRYFNVFGPRQNPYGPYSAVVPRWIDILLDGGTPQAFGDGSQSRAFTFVEDVVRANLLAAVSDAPYAVCNIGNHESTVLNDLFEMIKSSLVACNRVDVANAQLEYLPPRKGDVPSAEACLDRAEAVLGYQPTVHTDAGVQMAVEWFVRRRDQPESVAV